MTSFFEHLLNVVLSLLMIFGLLAATFIVPNLIRWIAHRLRLREIKKIISVDRICTLSDVGSNRLLLRTSNDGYRTMGNGARRKIYKIDIIYLDLDANKHYSLGCWDTSQPPSKLEEGVASRLKELKMRINNQEICNDN